MNPRLMTRRATLDAAVAATLPHAGVATPTEATAGGSFFALLLCVFWGDLSGQSFTWRELR